MRLIYHLLPAFFCLTIYFSNSVLASDWSISTVDDIGSGSGGSSIISDSSGNYLISYYDGTNGYLKFAKSTDGGANWTTSTVDDTADMGYMSFTSIDLSGNYLISYYDGTNGYLKFAKSTDGGLNWSTSTVDDTGDMGFYCSVTIDLSGNYLISYYDGTNGYLKFAKSTDGGLNWSTSTVDDTDDYDTHYIYVGGYNSITVDSEGNYLISYQYYEKYRDQDMQLDTYTVTLLLAKSTDVGLTWSISTIDDAVDHRYVGYHPSIKTDSDNNYLISYYGSSGTVSFPYYFLKFAKSTDGGVSWSTEEVKELGAAKRFDYASTSLGMDSSNNYLISYYLGNDGVSDNYNDLGFSESTDGGATWTNSLIDSTDDEVGFGSSINVDTSGNYLISYYDSTNGLLKFAKLNNPNPTSSPARTEDSLKQSTETPLTSDNAVSFPSQPQIPQSSSPEAGGQVLTATTGNQQATVIIEPKTFSFDAYFSAKLAVPNSASGLLPNPLSKTTDQTSLSSIPSNIITAGDLNNGGYLGIKKNDTIFWQVGHIQQIWYQAYAPGFSTNNAAKILPELQSKPSIVSLSYTEADLFPPGRSNQPFLPKSLKLAYSMDGSNWVILANSVVDAQNKTVSAVHKIGGYYMIVGPSFISPSATIIEGQTLGEKSFESDLPKPTFPPKTILNIPQKTISNLVKPSLIEKFFEFLKSVF